MRDVNKNQSNHNSIKQPKISVIMSVYNGERYLDESINSILQQTFKDFEFIIVDDGSTDNSLEIAEKHQRTDHRIILIKNLKNLGIAKSANNALRVACGKYIARADADDVTHKKRLEIQYEFLKKHPSIFLCGSNATYMNVQGKYMGKTNFPENISLSLAKYPCFINPSLMFLNEKVHYREKMSIAEDYDLLLRLLTQKKNLVNIKNYLVKVRLHSSSSTSSSIEKARYFTKKAQEFYRERLQYNKDSYNSRALLPYLDISPSIVSLYPKKILAAMGKSAKLAVIILNWKQPSLTTNCIKSLLANTYKNYKIFLVDNFSEDDSVKIFQKLFGKNTNIGILQTKGNLGYGGGNNYGAKIAISRYSPDYICILNNDTLVDKRFLENLLKGAENFGSENIYFPLIFFWESQIILSAGSRDYLPTPFQFTLKHQQDRGDLQPATTPFLSGCCVLISTKLYKKLKGFDESFFMYAEDIDFGIRAQRQGAKLYLIPQSKIQHKGATNFSSLSAYYTVRNSLYIWERYFNKSKCEYARLLFWFVMLSLRQFLKKRQIEVAKSIIAGFASYKKRELGKTKLL